jgi:hypothetical protein
MDENDFLSSKTSSLITILSLVLILIILLLFGKLPVSARVGVFVIVSYFVMQAL